MPMSRFDTVKVALQRYTRTEHTNILAIFATLRPIYSQAPFHVRMYESRDLQAVQGTNRGQSTIILHPHNGQMRGRKTPYFKPLFHIAVWRGLQNSYTFNKNNTRGKTNKTKQDKGPDQNRYRTSCRSRRWGLACSWKTTSATPENYCSPKGGQISYKHLILNFPDKCAFFPLKSFLAEFREEA